MTALVAAAARGMAAEGRGPHRLGHPCRHHSADASTQIDDDTTVAPTWRRRHHGMTAPAQATRRSSTDQAGKVAAHWPTLVATPLPPRNPFQTGKQCPTTPATPATWAPSPPATTRPATQPTAPLTMSAAITA